MEQTINKVNEILASFLGDRYKASATDTAVLINGTTIIEVKSPLIPQDIYDAVRIWIADMKCRLMNADYQVMVLARHNALTSSECRIKETETGELNPLNAEKSL